MARCGCWYIRRITLSFVVSIKTILFTLFPRKIYIFSDNFVQLRFIHWFTSLKMHSFCNSLLNFQIWTNNSLCNIWLSLSKSMKSLGKNVCLRWLTESYYQSCRRQFSFHFTWMKTHIQPYANIYWINTITISSHLITLFRINDNFTICLEYFQNILHGIIYCEWLFIVGKCVNWFVYRIYPTKSIHIHNQMQWICIGNLTFTKSLLLLLFFQCRWNVKWV